MPVLSQATRGLLRLAALASIALLPAAKAPAKAPKEPAAAALERCRSSDLVKERDCYSALFDERLATDGPAPVLELLDRLAVLDPVVRRDGHLYAHRIGISALKSPADVGRVFATCTPAHQSGCYHGVIQSYFIAMERQGGGVTAESVNKLCSDYRGTRADLLFQCTHGLGHGLAILQRHDLPQALTSCDLLTRAPEREMCYAGAFMESIVNATHPGHSVAPAAVAATPDGAAKKPATAAKKTEKKTEKPAAASGHGGHDMHAAHGEASAPAVAAASSKPAWRALDPADLHYPCSVLDEKYLIACYTIQTSAMLHHARNEIGPVAAECGRAPEKARSTCFLSLGRDVSTVAAGSNAEAVRLCGLAEAAFRPVCHRGVVESLVNMNANPSEGIPYCRAVAETDSKRACYTAVGLQASVLPGGEAKREKACAAAETAFVQACLGRPLRPAAAPAPTS